MNMEEVFEILSNAGPEKCILDKIPGRMLKDCGKILTEPILQIPSGCKTVTVRPICKKGEFITKELQTCFISACNI